MDGKKKKKREKARMLKRLKENKGQKEWKVGMGIVRNLIISVL